MKNRIGFSKDIHRICSGTGIVLCGEKIPCQFSLVAHSDGDVALHALAESILGALALGDLGKHFPDTDKATEGMDSRIIVTRVKEMMFEKKYKIGNVDLFISCEQPKLSSYIEKMRINISNLLETSIDNVSVKAGTNEKVGPVGNLEAIEAYCIVMLEEK